jgi:dTDP-4-dehydrorhamnose reductase
MTINALFPHRLADLCGSIGTRLIHVSTDCVFSGATGGYRESDVPDAGDLYGRSKQLGEVIRPGCLTLRTSIIGREITKSVGLLEWFMQRRQGAAQGYRRAVFSGLTTLALARVLLDVVSDHGELAGLYHVASEPICKLDLLQALNEALGLAVDIHPVDEPVIDRSLDASRFAAATGIAVPSWHRMIADLAEDPTPYDELRGHHGST